MCIGQIENVALIRMISGIAPKRKNTHPNILSPSKTDSFTALQYTGIGTEAMEGTAVPELTRFTKSSIDIQPDINFELLKTMGLRFDTDVRKGKNSTTGAISGNPAYDELTWFYNGLLHVAEPSTPGGATDAREHAFNPLSDAMQVVKSFSVERGSPQSLAEKAAGMRVVSYGMNYDIEKVEQTGAMLGRGFQVSQQMSTNEKQQVAITGSPTGGNFTLTITNPARAYQRRRRISLGMLLPVLFNRLLRLCQMSRLAM